MAAAKAEAEANAARQLEAIVADHNATDAQRRQAAEQLKKQHAEMEALSKALEQEAAEKEQLQVSLTPDASNRPADHHGCCWHTAPPDHHHCCCCRQGHVFCAASGNQFQSCTRTYSCWRSST